jgi:hypothetical protein
VPEASRKIKLYQKSLLFEILASERRTRHVPDGNREHWISGHAVDGRGDVRLSQCELKGMSDRSFPAEEWVSGGMIESPRSKLEECASEAFSTYRSRISHPAVSGFQESSL